MMTGYGGGSASSLTSYSVAFSLLAFFGYYILMGLGLAYGKRQILAPALAGWLPDLVFLFLGLLMIRRVR